MSVPTVIPAKNMVSTSWRSFGFFAPRSRAISPSAGSMASIDIATMAVRSATSTMNSARTALSLAFIFARLAAMKIDSNTRSVDLDPREPQFYQNPYPAYHAIRDRLPVFKWEQYGYWCFARHEDVSALLRDRRFGRQILHVASARGTGLARDAAASQALLRLRAAFAARDSNRRSTRGCAASSTAPSCRARWSVCVRQSRVLRNELDRRI